MSAQKIDVLAAIRFARETHDSDTARAGLARVEAAVAELIEADRECDRLEGIFPCAPEELGDMLEYHRRMVAARERRSAAIARIGGAAPATPGPVATVYDAMGDRA